MNQVKFSIDGKFSETNLQLKDMKKRFASTKNEIVMESILNVKHSIIERLKEKT